MVDTAFARARSILEAHRPTLEKSAEDLLERESLSEDELRPYFDAVHAGSKE